MKLNTYRCGCGRIETLPHAKARPGPCVHGTLGLRPIALRQPEWGQTRQLAVEYVVVHEDGAERVVSLRGWELETQPFRKADGSAHVAVRVRKGSRVVGRLWPAQQEDYGIAELARRIDARYRFDRGGKFFGALRGLVKQLNFARAGGMCPRAKEFKAVPLSLKEQVDRAVSHYLVHFNPNFHTTTYRPTGGPSAVNVHVKNRDIPLDVLRQLETFLRQHFPGVLVDVEFSLRAPAP